jgi:hypothetical protein
MRLPGFTAESSLVKPNQRYEAEAHSRARARVNTVVPQFWFCQGDYCCTDLGGSPYCLRVRHFLQ